MLVPDVLLEDPAGQKQMRMDIIALCAGVCSARFVSCGSLRGYVNALFKAIKELKGPAMVSSCRKTFPRFQELMDQAVKRYDEGGNVLPKMQQVEGGASPIPGAKPPKY